jgi:hypothetical protein
MATSGLEVSDKKIAAALRTMRARWGAEAGYRNPHGAAPKILGRGLPAESRLPTGGTRAAEEAEVRHGGCAAPGSRAAAADHGRGERRALSGRGEKD